MQDKSTGHSTQRSLHQQPPQINNSAEAELLFGFEVSTTSIADLFQDVALSLGYDMIEKELAHATAIKQFKKNFWQYLDCFNWVTEGSTTAIKMTLQTSEKNSTRVCKIRGLIGSRRQVKIFLTTFTERSEAMVKEQPSYFQDGEQMLDEPDNPFHLQACAAYMFHKILSNEQYGIGSTISQSIKNYSATFADVQKSVKMLPMPMKSAIVIIREIVDNLYKDFNLGRKEMEKIMPYCRISVEKYTFDKIERVITPIYCQRNSLENVVFLQKRAKILSQKKVKEMLSEIQLAEMLWLFEDEVDQAKVMDEIKTQKELRSILKYRKVCQELEKMAHVTNPRQKMKHCQIAYSVVKTITYEGTNKKNELANMEDIIPVFILIILLSDVPQIKAQFDMIIDFIEFDSCDLESERRLMLNLSESFNYICRDWKI